MTTQRSRNSLPQCRRAFIQDVVQGTKEVRKLLLGPFEDILRKQAATGAEFRQRNVLRRPQCAPHLLELARQQASKHCVYIARGVEIASLAELRRVPRVVAEFRMIEAQLHVARKGNRPPFPDLLLDELPKFDHRPFFCRSARSCGVRMNISTK